MIKTRITPVNTIQRFILSSVVGLVLTGCGQSAEQTETDTASEVSEIQSVACDESSTAGNLDASADCVMAEMNKSMSGAKNMGNDGLDKTVYTSEGGGFTIESAQVITEQVTTYPAALQRPPDIYRVTMYVEAYGDRIGTIEDRISFQQNGNRLDQKVNSLRSYIADGYRYVQSYNGELSADNVVLEEGRHSEVRVERYDAIMNDPASTLMLTGIGDAPYGYQDGGSKEIAGVTCKLWIRTDGSGEDCVWRGFDLYAATRDADGKLVPNATTILLRQEGRIPTELSDLANAEN